MRIKILTICSLAIVACLALTCAPLNQVSAKDNKQQHPIVIHSAEEAARFKAALQVWRQRLDSRSEELKHQEESLKEYELPMSHEAMEALAPATIDEKKLYEEALEAAHQEEEKHKSNALPKWKLAQQVKRQRQQARKKHQEALQHERQVKQHEEQLKKQEEVLLKRAEAAAHAAELMDQGKPHDHKLAMEHKAKHQDEHHDASVRMDQDEEEYSY
jgi:hypothetical protein